MNIIKNFFQFTFLASALFLAASSTVSAQAGTGGLSIQMHVEPQAAAYIKFDGVDGEVEPKEGRNIVGQNTRTGDKLIIVVKNGKLVQFGVLPTRGAFKALTPNASPCNPTLTCTTFNPPKCFTLPGGECVCSCGPWITSSSGGN